MEDSMNTILPNGNQDTVTIYLFYSLHDQEYSLMLKSGN